ncbi:DHHW family protein [Paenibacillus macerans]|uniref:DHHW family protein n=1 Tax=Paenibacillus macerans TaxID=44252 RepID=UPI003D31AB3F
MKELKGLPGTDQATIIQQGSDNTAKKSGTASASGQATQYLIYKDRAYTLFNYSASSAEAYAEALNGFKAAVDKDVHVYSKLVPTAAEFMEAEKYQELSDSQKSAFEHINGLLDSGIGRIDVYGALQQHISEDVYFRTDHHWTALGAYYAYVNLMDVMGEEAVPLSSYSTGKIENFLGSSYKATLSFRLKMHPDTITYYPPFAESTYTRHLTTGKAVSGKVVNPDYAKANNGFYAVFLGGDFPWGEIETDERNDKRIAVVKDSYGNALIPFLIPHFETVYYVDPRYYNGNLTDFVQEHQVTDVLFLNNSTAARTMGIAQLIDGLVGNTK